MEQIQLIVNFGIILSFTLSYPITIYPTQCVLKFWTGLGNREEKTKMEGILMKALSYVTSALVLSLSYGLIGYFDISTHKENSVLAWHSH